METLNNQRSNNYFIYLTIKYRPSTIMEINCRSFSSLSTTELYALLQLRSQVFVVEQDCVYQDIDGKDQKALHILGTSRRRVLLPTLGFLNQEII